MNEPMSPEMIIRLRTRLQLTQVDFAKRLNVTRQTIINWENEKSRPSAIYVKMMREMR